MAASIRRGDSAFSKVGNRTVRRGDGGGAAPKGRGGLTPSGSPKGTRIVKRGGESL